MGHPGRRPAAVPLPGRPTATSATWTTSRSTPDEFTHLFNTILINVTGFFRDQVLLGASVGFADVTRSRRYKQELKHANQGLEDAYAELQSTNEELQTINDELGLRTSELNQLNAFLESIWAGLGGAVAVLDPDLRVLVWDHGSEDFWGVRQDEVQGQQFLDLDIGLPLDQLRPALRQAISGNDGAQTTVVQATNRRGKTVHCRVTCSPLIGDDKSVRGVIVVVVEKQPPRLPAV